MPQHLNLFSHDYLSHRVNTIQERLDRICAAQRGAGAEFGLPRYSPFMVGRFYLNDKDLEGIRPLLKREPEKPNVGQVVDFPTNCGHSVKGVQSPWEVHQWRERDTPTPLTSRPRPSSSSPSKATPSPRPHAPSASARTSSATGSKLCATRANRPSPDRATTLPSRRRSVASAPRTSGCWRSATS